MRIVGLLSAGKSWLVNRGCESYVGEGQNAREDEAEITYVP